MLKLVRIYFTLFVCLLLPFILAGQNTCSNPISITTLTGQNCPNFLVPITLNTDHESDTLGNSSTNTDPACGFANGYTELWAKVVLPPASGGLQLSLNNIQGCNETSPLGCNTDLRIGVYDGGNCNTMVYRECVNGGTGTFTFPNNNTPGTSTVIIGGTPGDTLTLRFYEEDNEKFEFRWVAVTAAPPGSFCQYPDTLFGNGVTHCNWGAPASSMTPPGGGTCWLSNENTLFFHFEVDATTPQPVQITFYNTSCNFGNQTLQAAIYDGDCSTIGGQGANFHGVTCANGTFTHTSTTNPLPVGNYILAVDGNAAANCTWDFGGNVVLEAEYRYVEANFDGTKVVVNWETGVERDNRGYYIERSSDGEFWEEIGFTVGAGNSEKPRQYSYNDYELKDEMQFYRLRQLFQDGSESYSWSAQAEIDFSRMPVGVDISDPYPNPASNKAMLNIALKESRPVSISLLDAMGREVSRPIHMEMFTAGTHQIEIPVEGLSPGAYLCQLKAGGANRTVHLLVE